MIWPSPRVTMPRMRVRVVCGFDDTAAICSPTSALSKVDLPALGRPMRAAKPDLYSSKELTLKNKVASGLRRRRRSFSGVGFLVRRLSLFLNSDARDAAFVGLD